MATISEIAIEYAKKQPKQIDYITENSPIIDSIPYFPTTHGLRHAYEVLEDIKGGSFVDMGRGSARSLPPAAAWTGRIYPYWADR